MKLLSIALQAHTSREKFFPYLRQELGPDAQFSIDDGSLGVWGNRKKASARKHAIRYLELPKGDTFGFKLNNIDIGCAILDLSAGGARFSGRRVVCFRSTKTKPIPLSYGVVMSDKFAGSFRFDAKGRPGKNSFVSFQP